ncbi:MAG: hypothetical protein ACK41V_20330 [Acidovorax sp.]|uniref:hypothetical protein n=1 Tax=Acidovorax sp. TaxID=1872122 RepID=UPI0039188668
MFKKQLQINKYLNPKNFKDLFIGYVIFCTLLSISIPEGIIFFHEFIQPFTEVMCKILPGIESLARLSKTPLAIRGYYSFQWALLPYLLYKNFEVIKPKNSPTSSIRFSKTKIFQLVFYMVFLLCISVLMVYMLAFHVHTSQDITNTMPRGRGEGLAMALTNKYTAGLISSILHLTVATLFSAPILIARGILNRPAT